jgi:signal transduction histidine kinase
MPPFSRTVRFRLSVWYSSLLLVFGIAFVVALNLAARLDQPDGQLGVSDVVWEARRDGPGQAISVVPVSITLEDAEARIYSDNLDRLRTWSLVAVVGLALASGAGGYVLSGMMLRPVRDMTEVASEITATNLSRRINHQGPDDELKALADTFDSMIGRLEHSFEQQRQFVQNASHELRTPLAAIRMNIDVTEMDPEVSAEEYRALLETVKTQTARLTRLSEDLLLLSADERESPAVEPVELDSVVREAVRQLTPLANARDIALRVEGAPGVEAEANGDYLYRCVFNLVDNAIKYSGPGSSVTVRARQSPGSAEISVADNGPGIEPGQISQIFDRFYRVDRGRSRREGGVGLGLAIVKELVQGMGGTVNVESMPGAGATFTIRLPSAPASPSLTFA